MKSEIFMIGKVKQYGHSKVITLTKDVIEALDLEVDDFLQLSIKKLDKRLAESEKGKSSVFSEEYLEKKRKGREIAKKQVEELKKERGDKS